MDAMGGGRRHGLIELDWPSSADTVEKVDVERSPAIFWRMWFYNALNLLMRKIPHLQISASKSQKPTFSTVSAKCGRSRLTPKSL
jgi:hypothetical protein